MGFGCRLPGGGITGSIGIAFFGGGGGTFESAMNLSPGNTSRGGSGGAPELPAGDNTLYGGGSTFGGGGSTLTFIGPLDFGITMSTGNVRSGTLGGGYCGNYGLMCVPLITELAELTGDSKVQQRALQAVRAGSHFYYPGVDTEFQGRKLEPFRLCQNE